MIIESWIDTFWPLIHIDDQINNEAYYNLVRLTESKNDDNIKILKELIHTKDEQPLFDGVNKRKVYF